MSVRLAVTLSAFFLLVTAASAAPVDLGRAEGSLVINGKSTPLRFAYARYDNSVLEGSARDLVVLLTDRQVAPSALANSSELLRLESGGQLVLVEVRLTESGQPVRLAFHKGKKSISAMQFDAKSIVVTAAAVEGTVGIDHILLGDKVVIRVRFRAPIGAGSVSIPAPEIVDATTMFTPPPRSQQSGAHALPRGGGEPGKVWRAYDAALRKNDNATLFQLVTAAAADRLRSDRTVSMKVAFRPRKVEIVSGNVNGDIATLQVRGTALKTGSTATTRIGTVTLKKEYGAWKVDDEEWKTAQSF
ncbi:MAG: hypothetical protein DMF57_12425 [Acidobacteria bacterium]|nr:MAG: hypothetical protein DMF57_12425 [Acidobacteriota bacterium]